MTPQHIAVAVTEQGMVSARAETARVWKVFKVEDNQIEKLSDFTLESNDSLADIAELAPKYYPLKRVSVYLAAKGSEEFAAWLATRGAQLVNTAETHPQIAVQNYLLGELLAG